MLIFLSILISCKQSEEFDDQLPPEENRFVRSVLTQPGQLDEPMVMSFLKDGRILLVERKGNLKAFNPATSEVKTLATILVNTKYTSKEGRVSEAEEGLMGLIAHPDYDKNHWIFMYYADPAEPKHVLARWELHDDSLYASTKKVVLEVPTQRETCCHTGGGMAFDKNGNLYLTVGNNTGNPASGTSGLDERPDRSSWDDQRSAGNTNDLRGKILRIHPEDDGSYSIPEGNLFPEGTDKTRPEIYTMGHRNPWRISLDSKNGFIYWGEVGPDASRDSTIGPRGHDEFNQARKSGFFGWPYFIGDNKPYARYDYATEKVGDKFDPAHPVNNSPNNTGLTELPQPEKALIWYPYATSDEFPLVGSSGRSATGGPVFRKTDFKNSPRPFPSYYEGKWLITEFMRGWIMVITMDEKGNYKSMERFLPKENFSSAIDMQFGPEGDLYVLEYGSAWFRGNDNARIVKIEYNGGNRKPIVAAKADKIAGALPLKVNLSSEGTMDYDKDDQNALSYEWVVKSDGFEQILKEPNPSITLEKAGVYQVSFTATDTKGEKNSQFLELKAGNEAPLVDINIQRGNKSFYFEGSSLDYEITVNDKEDGAIGKGIQTNEVAINFDYAPEGFDLIEIASTHRATDEWITFSVGLNLINNNDCKSCHLMDKKSVGPAYLDVANKYKGDKEAQAKLAQKIIMGGGGVWGDHAMAAHPQIKPEQAANMVNYIMSLGDSKQQEVKALPLKGSFKMQAPADDNKRGGYLLRVAYKDKGTAEMQAITSEKIFALRNPVLDPELSDVSSGTQVLTTPSRSFSMVGNQSYLGYKNIDFTDIKQIELLLQAQPRSGAVGGIVEVHIDAADGPLLGQSEKIVPKDVDFRAAIQQMQQQQKNNKNQQGPNQGGALNAASIDFNALRRFMSVSAKVPVTNVEGTHDVYFVFKNPEAGENKILVQMLEIQFQNNIPPAGK